MWQVLVGLLCLVFCAGCAVPRAPLPPQTTEGTTVRTITPVDIATMLAQFAVDFPGFKLVYKDSASQRCRTFGATISVPANWGSFSPGNQYVRLVHEGAHLRQFAEWGEVGFLARYALSAGRRAIEQAAFQAEMVAVVEVYGAGILRGRRNVYIGYFTGADYEYMWRSPAGAAAAWVDAVIRQLTGGE